MLWKEWQPIERGGGVIKLAKKWQFSLWHILGTSDDHIGQIQGFVMLRLKKYFAFIEDDFIMFKNVLSFYKIFNCGRKPEQEYSFQGFLICFHCSLTIGCV